MLIQIVHQGNILSGTVGTLGWPRLYRLLLDGNINFTQMVEVEEGRASILTIHSSHTGTVHQAYTNNNNYGSLYPERSTASKNTMKNVTMERY